MKYTQAVTLLQNWTLIKKINSDFFMVEEEFIWYINYEEQTEKIIIPKWFMTDLGSIPPLFRPFFNRNKYVAYILHDYLYHKKHFHRKLADKIFFEALRVEKCPYIKAVLMYVAVRMFGWLHIKKF